MSKIFFQILLLPFYTVGEIGQNYSVFSIPEVISIFHFPLQLYCVKITLEYCHFDLKSWFEYFFHLFHERRKIAKSRFKYCQNFSVRNKLFFAKGRSFNFLIKTEIWRWQGKLICSSILFQEWKIICKLIFRITISVSFLSYVILEWFLKQITFLS